MNLYEMTYILRADGDDEAVTAANDRIATRLKDAKGELVKTEGWGRRRLAFPIDRVREGFYFTSIMRMPGTEVRSFENQLKLMPEVLRFLLLDQVENNVNLEGSLLPASHRPTPPPAPAETDANAEAPASEDAPSAAEEPATAEATGESDGVDADAGTAETAVETGAGEETEAEATVKPASESEAPEESASAEAEVAVASSEDAEPETSGTEATPAAAENEETATDEADAKTTEEE